MQCNVESIGSYEQVGIDVVARGGGHVTFEILIRKVNL